MSWSHLHPALIHFVLGFSALILILDMARLARPAGTPLLPDPPEESPPPASGRLEGLVFVLIVGVGSGWVALAHDRIIQNGGRPLPPGGLHEGMGLSLLALATLRTLGEGWATGERRRSLLTGIDLALLILLGSTAFMGEFLVFHKGMGLDSLPLHSP